MNKTDSGSQSTLHKEKSHESALNHVRGTALYIDDLPEPEGLLHIGIGLSTRAHATGLRLELSEVIKAESVIGVLSADDVIGHNDLSPTGRKDDPVFAENEVSFYGQPLFAVVATSRDAARRAVKFAHVTYQDLPFAIDIDQARQADYPYVTAPLTLSRGSAKAELDKADYRLSGQMRVGGQDHFYLESHIALALPGENGTMTVYSSTQHPSEVQLMVAHSLGLPSHAVTVIVRRLGGGFGGKETQSNFFAVVAALAARKFGRPVKFRPDRDEDMTATGKRHDFLIDYNLGFNSDGRIEAVRADYFARSGFSADLSGPVTDRTLFHADNAYFYPHVQLNSHPLKTNTVSNTAFRGFGGPQGMLGAERMIEDIAYHLGLDPLIIRRRNLYGTQDRRVTPYHQTIEDNILPQLLDDLEASSDYQERRAAILAYNEGGGILRKGIALTPVKFGISFTATWYNQGGALLLIYRDGSMTVSHGGIEMGQGLHTKIIQILAHEFGLQQEKVRLSSTSTDKVPNTSATAASSGTDINGMAVVDAAKQIKDRLIGFAADYYHVNIDEITFSEGYLIPGKKSPVSWEEIIDLAYLNRVSLSAAGFYKTPDIEWDRSQGRGKPFYYFSYGASVSEVSVDSLTGEYQVERVDILHDVGKSLNPAIDKGQIEGGFIQGLGWLTTEELWWDDKGRLRTHAPSTYKIPLASDCPRDFRVNLAGWSENHRPMLHRSKAVGEPPFMLAMSVLEALGMAVASHGDYKMAPRLDTPATPERLLLRIGDIREACGKTRHATG